MSDILQPGPHLDADQLNAFAEGALSEHERVQALAHLAECAHCREIAFLAQLPLAAEAVPAQETPALAPWWRRWLTPLPLMGTATLAGLLLVVLTLHTRTVHAPAQPSEMASTSQPQQPAPVATQPPPPSQPINPATSVLAKKEPPPPPKAAPPQPVAAPPAVVAAPQPAASADQAAAIQNLPLQGRNTVNAAPSKPEILNYANIGPGAARNQSVQENSAPPMAAPPPFAPNQQAAAGAMALPAAPAMARGYANQKALRATPEIEIEHGRGSTANASDVAGTIADASGAIVPGATITLTPNTILGGLQSKDSKAKAAPYQASTNAQGQFRLLSVPPGTYTLEIRAPGFAAQTRQLALQPHDLAQLHSTLPPAAASQTVTVDANSTTLTAEAVSDMALIQDSKKESEKRALPSKLPPASSALCNDRTLALDTAGTLFLERNGKHWKKIHPQWSGKIREVRQVQGNACSFQLTLEDGAVWISSDGEHWHTR